MRFCNAKEVRSSRVFFRSPDSCHLGSGSGSVMICSAFFSDPTTSPHFGRRSFHTSALSTLWRERIFASCDATKAFLSRRRSVFRCAVCKEAKNLKADFEVLKSSNTTGNRLSLEALNSVILPKHNFGPLKPNPVASRACAGIQSSRCVSKRYPSTFLALCSQSSALLLL